MLKRATFATALLFSLFSLTTPLYAAEKSNKSEKDIKSVQCKKSRAIAQMPKKVIPPKSLLRLMPKIFTLKTNCGDIVIQAFAKQAPVTITVLSALVGSGYYNRTLCHRLTTEGIFILQCGDPTATGSGDPGFRYQDENLPAAVEFNYPAGTVAMANSGPATNGSQFFIVYENTTLGANYTIWGRVTSGLEIVRYIAAGGVIPTARGNSSDGTPIRTIGIDRVFATR
jgi:peptidyl-prolyl cis-trans isomerase B (cyclophilin B)